VVLGAGASIAQFKKNELRGDDAPADLRLRQRPFVARLVIVLQRQIEIRVGKNGAHDFFGSPLT
jgi:hypothetical protein